LHGNKSLFGGDTPCKSIAWRKSMTLPFFTYILRCADGSYYVGQTDDLVKRFDEHRSGKGSRYTMTRLPVHLVWQEQFITREEAKAAEARIKGWSRAKKEALILRRFRLLPLLSSSNRESRLTARNLIEQKRQE
jgi:predicted GIY-YIG superfamily endonuclease